MKEVQIVNFPRNVSELDEVGYLLANRDVRKAGKDSVKHFLAYGHREGRMQFINTQAIGPIRDLKLSRLRFRRAPVTERTLGQAMNFISAETVEQFGIPEHPPISSHGYGEGLLSLVRANPDKLFMDLGAGLRQTYLSNVVTVDIFDSLSTDVISIGEELPFDDNQFDFLFCFAVLEHTRRPWDVAQEITRVVKPGGTIMIDYPHLAPVHGYPHHYFNATSKGNSSLFENDFDIVKHRVEDNQKPIFALAWMLKSWKAGLPSADAEMFGKMTVNEFLSLPAREQISLPFSKNLDPFVEESIAAGTTLVAKKRL